MNRESKQDPAQALKLFIVLSRTYKTFMEIDHQNIRSYGLHPTEFAVLELLYHKGAHPLQQIGGKILITSGTITYVIDKLEKKGLLARRTCPEDRRVIYADITEAGKVKMQEIFPGHAAALTQALAGLNEQEKAQAIHLLKKLSLHALHKK